MQSFPSVRTFDLPFVCMNFACVCVCACACACGCGCGCVWVCVCGCVCVGGVWGGLAALQRLANIANP